MSATFTPPIYTDKGNWLPHSCTALAISLTPIKKLKTPIASATLPKLLTQAGAFHAANRAHTNVKVNKVIHHQPPAIKVSASPIELVAGSIIIGVLTTNPLCSIGSTAVPANNKFDNIIF